MESILPIDITRLKGSFSKLLVIQNGIWKVVAEQEVHCGTLKFTEHSKVGESTLPASNPSRNLHS